MSSNNGVQAIFKPLNAALVALGQKPLSLVSVGTVRCCATPRLRRVQNLIGPLIPGHATGAVVKAPMVMVGEEAPQHPEVVIASNPAYRRRNLGLWATAGKMLGIPGFAQGGVVSYGQLEGLWDQAGGNPSMAALMAAIAEAESGGNPTAHNPSGRVWALADPRACRSRGTCTTRSRTRAWPSRSTSRRASARGRPTPRARTSSS